MSEEKFCCSICGHEIGQVEEMHGMEVLVIGGYPTKRWDGWCTQCGTKNSWYFPDKLLDKLVKDHQNLHKNRT